MSNLEDLKADVTRLLSEAKDAQAVEQIRIRFLGRKGVIAEHFSRMGDLSPEERRATGAALNDLKICCEKKIKEAADRFASGRSRGDAIDVTLPGRPAHAGLTHPINETLRDICQTFRLAGFDVADGPEIETDWYNFEALNVPADHPARDMHDTFYVKMEEDGGRREKAGEYLLRTHTSPVQIHVMEKQKPPVRIIAPGRVYRRDDDPTHSPVFHQVEGLWVEEGVTLRDLKGLLEYFLKMLFGESVRARFRPSFFPFTEPSLEVDMSCVICGGEDHSAHCRTCKATGWLEVLGAGMVHPNVFRAAGHNPSKVTGLAFGMGVERMAMIRYGIDDIRLFFENDVRFLSQLSGGT